MKNPIQPLEPEVFSAADDLELSPDEELGTYVERIVDAQEGDDLAYEDMEIAAFADRKVLT